MADPAIKKILLLHAPLVALIAQRIHAEKIPQQVQGQAQAYPLVVFSLVSSQESETFCGTDDFVAAQYQFDTYAKDRDARNIVAGEVRNALVRYSGTIDGTYVNKVRRDMKLDIGPEVEPGLYRRMQTFTIWHVEN